MALADIPNQYAEEVDTFRRILKLPDPRDSVPRPATAIIGIDDEEAVQELRPTGPSAMLPLNSGIRDAFDKFNNDLMAANLAEGKYPKPPPPPPPLPLLSGTRLDNLVFRRNSKI